MANQLDGIVGYFSTQEALVAATAEVRKSGVREFEVFSPFPIHGLDEVQGLPRSNLPFITLAGGLTGAICGFSLEYLTSVISWPINVGGKPLNSWPAFVPVMFEFTILFAGLSTLIGMLFLNRLPNRTKAPLHPKITCNRFALLIEQNSSDMKSLLEKSGAQDIEVIAQHKGWF
jgi:hypothetical protein